MRRKRNLSQRLEAVDALMIHQPETLAGRWLEDETDADRMLCVVSEKFVDQALGQNVSNADALGARVTAVKPAAATARFVEGGLGQNLLPV